ncbi:hypothetical protein Syun_025456 [Stephania yunnanensis]|uniref:Protein kinase domain-containing protein n=1 Tax=Stephania yunnanensis TaxID=152371 RepID=A0AAP0ES85_9MAGN
MVMGVSIFAVVVMVFVNFVLISSVVVDPYSAALMGLKSKLIDGSNNLQNWVLPSFQNGENSHKKISACAWSGITCSENASKVTALDLSHMNLSGSLSGQHLKALTDLTNLNLSDNSFSGSLPVEIFNLTKLTALDISRNNFNKAFPSGISSLKFLVVLDAFSNSFSGPLPLEATEIESLKVLNLAGSYFEGPIPSAYGSFKNLEFIHLAGNSLSGTIPPELGYLKKLTHMEIGYNSYSGSLPWQLGDMGGLQYLDIAGANLSGPIPDHLCNLTRLQSMFLFRNFLSGPVPSCFGGMISLVNLDVSDNLISGSIPDSFANLRNLKLLSLMYNDMGGSVSETIAELPQLETLLLWNNYFYGRLPRKLGRNGKLKYVDVSTNRFNGSIPPDICLGGVLMKLILFSNNFTGGLSPALANCSSLVRLRLEDNSFSGEIPWRFSTHLDISYVDLSRNRLSGGIPNDLNQASKLEYFNVSWNPDLSGGVPLKTWSMPMMQNFSASSCNISGQLPPFMSCKSVSVIELNGNSLSGELPNDVGNCEALKSFNLANNKLSGEIPDELASLPVLRLLDLSHNELKGSIPGMFGSSSSLISLNLSFNDVAGSIPPGKIFETMDQSAFIGNPKLCGAPLQSCSNSKKNLSGFKLGNKRSEKVTWALLLSAGVVLFVVMAVLGILYVYRERKEQWKMVAFSGLPIFKANDILRSFSYTEAVDRAPPLSTSVCKAVLPTGITVLVKKIEWDAKRKGVMSEFITKMGNARHKNLARLLGFCSNNCIAYLLYDYLPNGNLDEKMRMKGDSAILTWPTKQKIVIGIAKGLCYLHHDCHPAIPHGDLKARNIVFDDNMELYLAGFGLKTLLHMDGDLLSQMLSRNSSACTGEIDNIMKEEIFGDVYSFGEILFEILTNGRMRTSRGSTQNKAKETILKEIYDENEVGSNDAMRGEIKMVLEVALLCTKSRSCDRPTMEVALKLLSGLKPRRNSSDFEP